MVLSTPWRRDPITLNRSPMSQMTTKPIETPSALLLLKLARIWGVKTTIQQHIDIVLQPAHQHSNPPILPFLQETHPVNPLTALGSNTTGELNTILKFKQLS